MAAQESGATSHQTEKNLALMQRGGIGTQKDSVMTSDDVSNLMAWTINNHT